MSTTKIKQPDGNWVYVAQGAQGPQGLQGSTGPQGPAGFNSTVPGPAGPAGNTGPQGPVALLTTQTDTYTTPGTYTWTKPAGAVTCDVMIQAGGGGGGAGARGATGTARVGGSGGGGGAYQRITLNASDLPPTMTVQVGAGGAGAGVNAVDSSTGANGLAGGISAFGTNAAGVPYWFCNSGSFGNGGGIAAGGVGSTGPLGNLGSTSSSLTGTVGSGSNYGAGSTGITGPVAASSGGGGGGVTTANVASNGGTAIERWDIFGYTTLAAGVGGTAGTNGNSSTIVPPGTPMIAGVGGTGGGSGTAGVGGTGGNGVRGGGGGGGGASTNGFNGGGGGNGGNGFVQIVTVKSATVASPSAYPTLATNLANIPQVKSWANVSGQLGAGTAYLPGSCTYSFGSEVETGTGRVVNFGRKTVNSTVGLNPFTLSFAASPLTGTAGATAIIANMVPVTPGGTITLSCRMRARMAVGMIASSGFLITVYGFDQNGVYLANVPPSPAWPQNVYTPDGATWSQLRRAYTIPANCSYVGIIWGYGAVAATNLAVNDYVDICDILISTDDQWPTYFDGDTAGAAWASTANASVSLLVSPRKSDLDPYNQRGIGSPEGVVQAPVGATYTDIAATNGAIRWVKTGFVGVNGTTTAATNTGWRVQFGDTGLRTINASNWLVNGWTGTCYARRIADRVTLSLALTQPGAYNATFMNIPVGWQRNPNINIRAGVGLYGLGAPDIAAGRQSVVAYQSHVLSVMDTMPVGATIGAELSWQCTDAWPTTLP